MAISQGRINGKDCTIELTTDSGNKFLVNFLSYTLNYDPNRNDSRVAQSGKDQFTVPWDKISIEVEGKRGLAETYKDLLLIARTLTVTAFVATDFDDPVPDFGPGKIFSLTGSQPEGDGTYRFRIDFGYIASGYDEV